MIGISVASNKEWNYIKEYYSILENEIIEYIYGEYFFLEINGKEVLIYICGVRRSNSSASTQYMIDKFNLDKIILIGTTAGVNKKYNIQDVLIPTKMIQGDCDFIENGESFSEKFIVRLDLSSYNIINDITIASFDKPLIYKSDSQLMIKNKVDIRDMEAASVANVCKLNNIELIVIKGITDFPDNYEPTDENQYLEYMKNVPIVMNKILNDFLKKFI